MEFKLSQESVDFLNDGSYKGRAWLSTKDGRVFLQAAIALLWLITDQGISWLDSPQGKKWIMEEENNFDHFLTSDDGWKLLDKSNNAKEWLIKTKRGNHWLTTGNGYNWLHTEAGRKWMDSPMGKIWLNVPEELLSFK